MKPHFGDADIYMYYDFLNKATTYFEFGSGGSTYQALTRNNITKVYSVESDLLWYTKLNELIEKNKNLKKDKLNFFLIDLKCKPNTWGNPGINCKTEDMIRYSNSINELSTEEKSNIDLVLIDGRFRVACCLKCFSSIKDNCLIIFDDFLNRKQYHIVLEYFDIIKITRDKRMVILKKKKCEPPSLDLITKYELIQD